MGLDEETLFEILGVPTMGIRCIKLEKGSVEFFRLCGAKDFNNRAPKGEFQLLLKLVKGLLLPRYDKVTTLTDVNLFQMEVFFKYKKVNLPTIIIENMNTVVNAKTGRHGLPYGFWLNRVFA